MENLLQTVISQQSSDAMKNFRPVELVQQLLARLSDRDRWIMEKRYGLDKEKSATLEEIGKELGVTRERVRQIETSIIKKLMTDKMVKREFTNRLETVMSEFGGMVSLDTLVGILENNHTLTDRDRVISALRFLMRLDANVVSLPLRHGFNEGWSAKSLDIDKIRVVAKQVTDALDKAGQAQTIDQIAGVIPTDNLSFLQGVLSVSSLLGHDLEGGWGLVEWSTVRPKRIRDKVFQVFKKVNKPLHFQEIADQVNKYYPSKRLVLARTVHNELIGDKRFVLVGRGIYALAEWGYQPGTVANVIKEILETAGKPMKSSDIIQEVLKKRQVKSNTVIANLHSSKLFKKNGRATYALA